MLRSYWSELHTHTDVVCLSRVGNRTWNSWDFKTHPVYQGDHNLIFSPSDVMGQSFSFFSLKHHPPKQDPIEKKHQPGVFSKMAAAANKPGDFVHLISNCISAASTRTQEYLAFKDPEEKFHPSPRVLIQVFLMTYITQIFSLNVTDAFSCTVPTPEQRVLLGADWVWAMLEEPSQNPKIQIVVQVLHLPEGEKPEETAVEANMESIKMAQMESGGMNPHEKTVDFRASVGKDCFALFLFFGKQDDQENIYGVLSNNFEAAIAKGNKVDRRLIEHFFKGSSRFHTPLEIMQAVFSIKTSRHKSDKFIRKIWEIWHL